MIEEEFNTFKVVTLHRSMGKLFRFQFLQQKYGSQFCETLNNFEI